MRILVVGAGGVGGFFGGKLLAAGRDVTFLVRPRRAAALAKTGLVIQDGGAEIVIADPPTVTSDSLSQPYDLIVLSCKAYDLDGAIESFAPAVGPDTAILPLLNGMAHVDVLVDRFGDGRVLGGYCKLSVSLDEAGRIVHHDKMNVLGFGERDGSQSARFEAISEVMAGAGFDTRPSRTVLQDMWEKWVFIASGAGITCLMRAAVGDIVEAGGTGITNRLVDECATIAAKQGFPPSEASLQACRTMFTAPGSTLMASMLRDLERGGLIEADQIIADLLRRGGGNEKYPVLDIVHTHLKAHEARRAREGGG